MVQSVPSDLHRSYFQLVICMTPKSMIDDNMSLSKL